MFVDNPSKFKRSQEPFLQEIKCSDIAPKLGKCQECKMTRSQLDRRENIYCRFIAFRRLKFNSKSVVAVAGFSEPSDADVDDLKLWYPVDSFQRTAG